MGIGTEMRAIFMLSDANSYAIAHYFLLSGGLFSKLRAIFNSWYIQIFYCAQWFNTVLGRIVPNFYIWKNLVEIQKIKKFQLFISQME